MAGRPTVLVTGARGYLGGRLVRHLAEVGVPVIGTSRGAAPAPGGWPPSAVLAPLTPTDDSLSIAPALAGVGCVIHLAAANEIRSGNDPDAAVFETGVGTRRVLEAAIRAGVSRFIYLSTIHVYGALKGRLSEASAARPAHPYAVTHRLAEDFVLAAHDAGRIEGAVVRLSNGIGAPAWPEMDRWSLVGNDLARQAVLTGELVLKAPGQWRDFIALSDVCQGLETLASVDRNRLGDGLFNLGGGRAWRIDDIARLTTAAAEQRMGRPVGVRYAGPAPDGAPAPFDYVIDKMRGLGFSPSGEEAVVKELGDTVDLLLRSPEPPPVAEGTGAGA